MNKTTIYCKNCKKYVELDSVNRDKSGNAICSECDKPITCPRSCRSFFKIDDNGELESSICSNCGLDIETLEDEGDDLYPNGRDRDAEDEDSFG